MKRIIMSPVPRGSIVNTCFATLEECAAKGNGFDVKALRTIVRMRKLDANERAEQEAVLETYLHALGMLGDLPLGQAAVRREFGDTKVTISTPGMEPVETTTEGLRQAAAFAGTRAGRRKIKELAARS